MIKMIKMMMIDAYDAASAAADDDGGDENR